MHLSTNFDNLGKLFVGHPFHDTISEDFKQGIQIALISSFLLVFVFAKSQFHNKIGKIDKFLSTNVGSGFATKCSGMGFE